MEATILHCAPLFDAEDRHFWFRARNAVLDTIVAHEIEALPAGYRVLEVGCGTGYVLRMLKSVCSADTVVGLDLFREGLAIASHPSGAHLVQGRVEAPPFRTPFDVVGIFDTLEHVEDDATVLTHVRNMLTPGGALLITVPASEAIWSDFDDEVHHCRRYEPDVLQSRLMEAGFRVEYLTPFMSVLYPIARVGRFLADTLRRRDVGGTKRSALGEQLKIVPVLNGFLAVLLAQEARVVERRGRLPFGTSLLALARRR